MTTDAAISNDAIEATEVIQSAQSATHTSEAEVGEKLKSIHVQLLGKHIDLAGVSKRLSHQFYCQQFKDALFINLPRGNAFIFDYGVVVFWSVIESKRQSLFTKINIYISEPYAHECMDAIRYVRHPNEAFLVRDDVVYLPNIDMHTLLSISHALAQSSKLAQFEIQAQNTITAHAGLTESLANTGKIPLSRKALSMERGRLFRTKSDIILHFNLLDTPEYFWQYPEQQSLYMQMATYLELTPRVTLLNLKLSTIDELLNMLATEQHHKYSASLEWVIITLIAVNIVAYALG